MKVQQLNKIDVTRYRIGDPIYTWLYSHGYTAEIIGNRLFLVRPVR